jgi:hypothetical protein
MKSKFIVIASLATLCAGLLTNRVAAAIPLGENSHIQIGGFISQGYIKSDGNNYPFEDKDGTFDFREMAFNASGTIGAHLRIGGQLFAQRLGNYGDDKVKLDWANADYNFRQEFGVRVGRIKYPKGLYGEALDLDVIRPFIFLPMSVYNPIFRDFSASFDGGMGYGTLTLGAKGGSLDYKLFYGDIQMNKDQGVADFFTNSHLYAGTGVQTLTLDSVVGGSLDWSTPISGLKVHFSLSHLKNIDGRGQFAAAPVLPVSILVKGIDYTSAGVEYARNNWTFAAEYFKQEGDTLVQALPVLNSSGKYGTNSWYVSAARRLNDKWEVGGYYAYSNNRHPTAGSVSDAKQLGDWALSLRYDVNEHITVKAEGHWISGYYNILNTAKNPNPVLDDTTTFFAVKTTLSF